MKKLVLTLVALCAIASVAHAGKVQVQKELGWKVSDSTKRDGDQQVLYVARPLDSEAVDTTGIFSLNEASFAGPGSFSGDIAYRLDSCRLRRCVLGLHGRWGEHADCPHGNHRRIW